MLHAETQEFKLFLAPFAGEKIIPLIRFTLSATPHKKAFHSAIIDHMARNIKGGKKLDAFLRKAKNAKSVKEIQVGFFASSKYPDGTPVAAVAAFNEFGTKRIPERPFFRQAISGADEELKPVLLKSINPRTMALDRKTAGKLGQVMQGRIQRSIVTLREPALAPSTIARRKKKSTKPLIDTGTLLKNVTYRVID